MGGGGFFLGVLLCVFKAGEDDWLRERDELRARRALLRELEGGGRAVMR